MADVKRSVNVGPATAQITATNPAVIRVMSTQPGTSPLSSLTFHLVTLVRRALPIDTAFISSSLCGVLEIEFDSDEPWVDRKDHRDRQNQKDHWNQHRDLAFAAFFHQRAPTFGTDIRCLGS